MKKASMKQKSMKKQMYNEDSREHSAKPAHRDIHSISKIKGSDEVGHKKAAGGAKHKGMDGPSEMASTHGGPKHKGITGPSEMGKPGHMFYDGKGEPTKSVADHMGDLHGYLGEAGKPDNLKKGHTSLAKVNVHENAAQHGDEEQYDDGEHGQYGGKGGHGSKGGAY